MPSYARPMVRAAHAAIAVADRMWSASVAMRISGLCYLSCCPLVVAGGDVQGSGSAAAQRLRMGSDGGTTPTSASGCSVSAWAFLPVPCLHSLHKSPCAFDRFLWASPLGSLGSAARGFAAALLKPRPMLARPLGQNAARSSRQRCIACRTPRVPLYAARGFRWFQTE